MFPLKTQCCSPITGYISSPPQVTNLPIESGCYNQANSEQSFILKLHFFYPMFPLKTQCCSPITGYISSPPESPIHQLSQGATAKQTVSNHSNSNCTSPLQCFHCRYSVTIIFFSHKFKSVSGSVSSWSIESLFFFSSRVGFRTNLLLDLACGGSVSYTHLTLPTIYSV